MKKILLFTLLFFITLSFASAKMLEVSTVERKPFVFKNEAGKLTGFSVDLWNEIASRNGYTYSYKIHKEFKNMLKSVEEKKSDLAIANISITSAREKVMDFSYPFYDSGIVVLIPKSGAKPPLAEVLMSSWILRVITILILLFLAAIHIIWLKDRKKDFNLFDRSYFGVFQVAKKLFLYFFSKDGKKPQASGRTIFIITLIILFFIISIFTSKFTSYTIVNSLQYKIKGVNDLQGVKLAVAEKTTMEEFAKKQSLKYKKYGDFLQSVRAVETLETEAALGSAATSKYYASRQADKKIILAGKVFAKDKIAIAFPNGSKLRDEVNKTLLEIQEDGTYQKLINKYFSYK